MHGNTENPSVQWSGGAAGYPYEFTNAINISSFVKEGLFSESPSDSEFSKRHFLAIGSSEKEEGNLTFKPSVVSTMPCAWKASNGFVSVGESDGIIKGISAGREVITCTYSTTERQKADYTGTVSCDLTVLNKPSDNKPEITPVPSEITGPEQVTLTEGSFTLKAFNSAGESYKQVIIEVLPPMTGLPTIEGDSVITLKEGYSDSTFGYQVSGTPFPKLTLKTDDNTAKATLSGNGMPAPWIVTIPSGLTAGSYGFTLEAKNDAGTTNKTVQVNVSTLPSITGPAEINLSYMNYTERTETYNIAGEPAPTLSLQSTEPDNFELSGNSLIIKSGLHHNSSPYTVTLVAENRAGKVELPITVNVYDPYIVLNVPYDNQAEIGENFNWALPAQGGAGGPYTYYIEEGNLPNGLTLSSDGNISGKPADEPGLYSFKIQVTDGRSLFSTTHDLTITLTEPILQQAGTPLQKSIPSAVLNKHLAKVRSQTAVVSLAREPAEKEAAHTKDLTKDSAKQPAAKDENETDEPAPPAGICKEGQPFYSFSFCVKQYPVPRTDVMV